MSSSTSKQFPYGFPFQVGVSGTTNAGPLLAAVPTVAADLVDKDAYLFQVTVTNSTGSAITLTINDKQGSPIALMAATEIAGATTVAFNWEEGVFMSGGINWVASGAGLTGSVVAFYRA